MFDCWWVLCCRFPQSMEQLLERQWEQGSQFLMEQGQHFDSEQSFLVTFALNWFNSFQV